MMISINKKIDELYLKKNNELVEIIELMKQQKNLQNFNYLEIHPRLHISCYYFHLIIYI